jgi:hypothetical protein
VSCEHETDYLFLSGGLDGRGETKIQFLSLIESYARAGRRAHGSCIMWVI